VMVSRWFESSSARTPNFDNLLTKQRQPLAREFDNLERSGEPEAARLLYDRDSRYAFPTISIYDLHSAGSWM